MNDLSETRDIIRSGVSAIHICGDDYTQIDEFITGLAGELGFVDENEPAVVEWNYGYGQVKFKTVQQTESAGGGKMPLAEFLETYKNPVYAEKKIILIRNARHVLEGEANRENLAQLQQTVLNLKKRLPGKVALIYCDERRFIPDELSSLVYFLELKPPSREGLADMAEAFLEEEKIAEEKFEVDPEVRNKLSSMCVGMSGDSFRQILKKAALKKETFNTDVISIAQEAKKQFVDKSGLLKYVTTSENLSDIGGLDYLQFWLRKKEHSIRYPDEARNDGITPPKGILLVGMPGCGKSLSAKAAANLFGFPLLRLDVGSLMGKYVGESEENLRRALAIAEHTSPCVLWIDELEKAFSGIEGDGTGITARLFGSFLTWLQEKTAPVFVVATANNISMLRPEILRRGRFDEIFYVGFPNEIERKQIFKIHLDKLKIEKDENIDVAKLAEMTKISNTGTGDNKTAEPRNDETEDDDGYAGSDIEALINDAAETARKEGRPLSQAIIERNMKYMTPLKVILGDKLKEYKEIFDKYRIKPASRNKNELEILETQVYSRHVEERLKAAQDELITEDFLQKLAKDADTKVKLAVLDNPRCSPDIIMLLRDDPDETVKAKAIEKFGGSEKGIIEIAKTGTKEQKIKLPELRNLPEEAQMLLANDSDRDILIALLQYPYLSEPVWHILAKKAENDHALEQLIVAHPKCPAGARQELEKSCMKCISFWQGKKHYHCLKKSTGEWIDPNVSYKDCFSFELIKKRYRIKRQAQEGFPITT
jgi:SpoVK/Ycf46/Vps4 family AAA+-type ATPase